MKIERNDPCFCGSGKKYKKCCLGKPPEEMPAASGITAFLEELKVRQTEEGTNGKIISSIHNGVRYLVAGNRSYYSRHWKTFPDFLNHYIKDVLDEKWFKTELDKPFKKQHTVVQWHVLINREIRKNKQETPEINPTQKIGAEQAYLNLAYNLFILAQNPELQGGLLSRLKNKDTFSAALYDIFTAASLLKAGFDVEYGDETANSKTHFEFTATERLSGKKYSVEPRERPPFNKENASLSDQLYETLKKKARHDRVIFIDLNISRFTEKIEVFNSELESKAKTMTIHNKPAPAAYVFITNYGFVYDLDGFNYEFSGFLAGFKMEGLKLKLAGAESKEDLVAREKHTNMAVLLDAVRSYNKIPQTF